MAEGSVAPTCSKCHQESKACTLRLRQLGLSDNVYLICDATCRDAILSDLPLDAQPKKAEFVLQLDDLDAPIVDEELSLPRSSADSERLKQYQVDSFSRKCHHCGEQIEEAGLSNVHWQFMDFCCGDCLFEYHKKSIADTVASAAGPLIGKCATCDEEMAVDDKVGRFMILHGRESKAFCNESCLVRYKDTHRVCLSCTKSEYKQQLPQVQSEWQELDTVPAPTAEKTEKARLALISESVICCDSGRLGTLTSRHWFAVWNAKGCCDL